jgi:fatty-acyl-CoA synthase
VDTAALRFGEPVKPTGTAHLGEESRAAHDGWLVGHGTPLPEHGVHISILDDDGKPVAEGHLGEIAVTGPNVTDGYHAGREGGSSRFVDGQLRTGDAGFVHEGDLFVLGRMGDALKVNGRSVYVEDLDVKVAAATGLNKSRLAVVAVRGAGAAASVGGVALFAEAKAGGDWPELARAALRGQLGDDVPITLIAGTRGLIKRTSSGKPRRSHMWRLFQEGDLGQAVVVEEATADAPG